MTIFRISWERRGWDSNPRGYYPYTISSRARSTGLCHLSTRPKTPRDSKGRRTSWPSTAENNTAGDEESLKPSHVSVKTAGELISAASDEATGPEAWETADSACQQDRASVTTGSKRITQHRRARPYCKCEQRHGDQRQATETVRRPQQARQQAQHQQGNHPRLGTSNEQLCRSPVADPAGPGDHQARQLMKGPQQQG